MRRLLFNSGCTLVVAFLLSSPCTAGESAHSANSQDNKQAEQASSSTSPQSESKSETNQDSPTKGQPEDAAAPPEEDYGRGVPVEAASKNQKALAKKQFLLALELFEAGKYAEALRLFRMSYGKVASPNSQLMVARCLVKLERYSDAYAELTALIREAKDLARSISRYEGTVKAGEKELLELKKHIALIKLDVDAEVTLNGKSLAPEKWNQELPVAPGSSSLTLRLKNGQEATQQVELAAGEERSVSLKLPKPKAQRAPATAERAKKPLPEGNPNDISRSTLGYVGLGVGGVGVIGFTAFGLLNNSTLQKLKDQCQGVQCPESAAADAEQGRTYQTLANVSLGVGIFGLVSATYFLLTAEEPQELTTAQGLGLGPDGVSWKGNF